MSDYEGDWEPVNSQVATFQPVLPPEPTHNYIVPKGTSLLEAEEAAKKKPRRPRRENYEPLPSSYRPALQSLLHRRAPVTNGNFAKDLPQKEHVQQRVRKLESFKSYERSAENPNAVFEMMHPWEALVKALPRQQHISPLEYAKDQLAEICLGTDAFIPSPNVEQNFFRIWGTPEQVQRALANLQRWELHVKGPGKEKTSHKFWPRQTAVDGRGQDREMRKEFLHHQHEAFQQFADEISFPFEAYLVWPEGYDLINFIDEYDADVLQKLRREYNCNIIHSREGIRASKISCENEPASLQVYARLMGLMKEMIARRKQSMHRVICPMPSFETARAFVSVNSKVELKQSTVRVPEMVGEPLPQAEADQWKQLRAQRRKKERSEIKTALRSCIRSLHISQKHVRMRVSFGAIGLAQYKRPANGQDFEIEEFITMMQNQGVQNEQVPLQTGTTFEFIDFLDTELGEPDFSWAVHFDFSGAQGGTLRLEREFVPSANDPDQPSISATRWLSYGADSTSDVAERLQLDHVDLEKIGYQVHVGAANIYHNNRANDSLQRFENSVGFKPSLNGLRFPPSKHAIFPPGNTELTDIEEIAVARYPFKETRGTLEIRRKDIFLQRVGDASSLPSRTEWQANYYYQEWDNLMSDFANIESGEAVRWPRELHTFFPKTIDEDSPKALPLGFKNFMKEVEEIQELLTKALRAKGHGVNGIE